MLRIRSNHHKNKPPLNEDFLEGEEPVIVELEEKGI
jgi:hypothetical protein